MTIVELAEQLQSKCEEWGRQHQAIQNEGFWDQRVSDIGDTEKGLQDPVEFLRWASDFDEGPTGINALESFNRALTLLSRLEKRAGEDPAGLLNSPDISHTVSALKEFSRDVESLATARWSAIVGAIKWDSADLWSAYRDSREYGQTVERAGRLDHQLDGLKKHRYLSKHEDRETFVEIVSQHQEVVALLPPPPDETIRAFFHSAQTGVPLSQVDDGLMEWLRTHQLLSSFIVRYQR